MTDITVLGPARDNTPRPQADTRTPAIVGGVLVSAGLVVLLQIPGARDACGRFLRSPEVQAAGRDLADGLVREAAASLSRHSSAAVHTLFV